MGLVSSSDSATDPYGRSLGTVSGLATGFYPSSAVVANSGGGSRWKRDQDVAVVATQNATVVVPLQESPSHHVSLSLPSSSQTNITVDVPSGRTMDVSQNLMNQRRRREAVVPIQPINATTTKVLVPATGELKDVHLESNSTVQVMPPSVTGTGEVRVAQVDSDQVKSRQRRGMGGYNGYIGGVQGFPMFGQSAGTAIGQANALQGRSFSSGNTFSHGGLSNSNAMGMADGLSPSSTSIANSQSSGFNRRRRDTQDATQEEQSDGPDNAYQKGYYSDEDSSLDRRRRDVSDYL